MAKLIYPELSYKIMGVLFAVHNELGPGHMEKHYQRAIRERFDKENIKYKEQVGIKVNGSNSIGHYHADFVVENKIILEIKAAPRLTRDFVLQIIRYLKETDLELGILATFSRRNLIYRRILKGFKI